jgi:hypothetical protein
MVMIFEVATGWIAYINGMMTTDRFKLSLWDSWVENCQRKGMIAILQQAGENETRT